MSVKLEHIVGFFAAAGLASAGFLLYRKKGWVTEWGPVRHKRTQRSDAAQDYTALSLAELEAEKERLEDLIVQRELAARAESENDDTEPAA